MTIPATAYFPPDFFLDPDATLMEALRLMLEHEVNHVPLCETNGRFIGVISTNAILKGLMPVSARGDHALENLKFAGDATRLLTGHLRELEHKAAREAVDSSVQVLDENSPLLETALLLAQSTAPLPVVGADGKLRGMLSRRALLKHLVRQVEAENAR
jgi:CBS domain-containing protein